MNYTDEQISGICYEITGYMSSLMEDVLADAEERTGRSSIVANAYADTTSFVFALATIIAGPAGAALGLIGQIPAIVTNVMTNVRQQDIRELRADISTGKIETAICDLKLFIERDDGFSYDTLIEWSEYQIYRANGPGFDWWASLVPAINDASIWEKRAAIGAAHPHQMVNSLCATSSIATLELVLYAENGSPDNLVQIEAPDAASFRIDGTYWTPNGRANIATQRIVPAQGAPEDIIVYRFLNADDLPGFGYVSFQGEYGPTPGTPLALLYLYDENRTWLRRKRGGFGLNATELREKFSCRQMSKFGFAPNAINHPNSTLAVRLGASPDDLSCVATTVRGDLEPNQGTSTYNVISNTYNLKQDVADTDGKFRAEFAIPEFLEEQGISFGEMIQGVAEQVTVETKLAHEANYSQAIELHKLHQRQFDFVRFTSDAAFEFGATVGKVVRDTFGIPVPTTMTDGQSCAVAHYMSEKLSIFGRELITQAQAATNFETFHKAMVTYAQPYSLNMLVNRLLWQMLTSSSIDLTAMDTDLTSTINRSRLAELLYNDVDLTDKENAVIPVTGATFYTDADTATVLSTALRALSDEEWNASVQFAIEDNSDVSCVFYHPYVTQVVGDYTLFHYPEFETTLIDNPPGRVLLPLPQGWTSWKELEGMVFVCYWPSPGQPGPLGAGSSAISVDGEPFPSSGNTYGPIWQSPGGSAVTAITDTYDYAPSSWAGGSVRSLVNWQNTDGALQIEIGQAGATAPNGRFKIMQVTFAVLTSNL